MKNIKRTVLNVAVAGVMTLGLMSIAGPARADVDAPHAGVLGGTVPFCASWAITTDAGAATFFTGATIADYDAGLIELVNFVAATDFDANTKFKISAKKSAWTLPANYDVTNGAKKTAGTDADLLIKVAVDTAGVPAASAMTVDGTFGSAYKALTTSDQRILGGGAVGAGAGTGLENAAFSVDAEVLMDWQYDIVGAYEVTVTLTIGEETI